MVDLGSYCLLHFLEALLCGIQEPQELLALVWGKILGMLRNEELNIKCCGFQLHFCTFKLFFQVLQIK